MHGLKDEKLEKEKQAKWKKNALYLVLNMQNPRGNNMDTCLQNKQQSKLKQVQSAGSCLCKVKMWQCTANDHSNG
eukprot:scaffold86967_cov13-Tisochrysis_lutea.AAC.1